MYSSADAIFCPKEVSKNFAILWILIFDASTSVKTLFATIISLWAFNPISERSPLKSRLLKNRCVTVPISRAVKLFSPKVGTIRLDSEMILEPTLLLDTYTGIASSFFVMGWATGLLIFGNVRLKSSLLTTWALLSMYFSRFSPIVLTTLHFPLISMVVSSIALPVESVERIHSIILFALSRSIGFASAGTMPWMKSFSLALVIAT